MQFVFLYVTSVSKKEAVKISTHLLKERLVACVNMFPLKSMYWWNEKICTKSEYAIILKTEKGAFPLIEKAIMKLHSYSVPCITKISVEPNKGYGNWLMEQLVGKLHK
ncbi:divalent-cation tolerance protein CutA [Candidatus Woesearchaeota archaeon CG10_big_fil_rev_8_21_14_0_10_36_11]|nr:MAG: divalent-cation tolerance protein CutA [Candidatus Woesearchaeota archaeon CG10_big_fil_rev_8_21_14_0_10_36_11]